jgi:hypothetical protein
LEKLESLEEEVFIYYSSANNFRQVLGVVDSVLDWQYRGSWFESQESQKVFSTYGY